VGGCVLLGQGCDSLNGVQERLVLALPLRPTVLDQCLESPPGALDECEELLLLFKV